MDLNWHEISRDRMVAWGAIKHRVWRAHSRSDIFYARSGMDVHGPYQTAQEARHACAEIESREPA